MLQPVYLNYCKADLYAAYVLYNLPAKRNPALFIVRDSHVICLCFHMFQLF